MAEVPLSPVGEEKPVLKMADVPSVGRDEGRDVTVSR